MVPLSDSLCFDQSHFVLAYPFDCCSSSVLNQNEADIREGLKHLVEICFGTETSMISEDHSLAKVLQSWQDFVLSEELRGTVQRYEFGKFTLVGENGDEFELTIIISLYGRSQVGLFTMIGDLGHNTKTTPLNADRIIHIIQHFTRNMPTVISSFFAGLQAFSQMPTYTYVSGNIWNNRLRKQHLCSWIVKYLGLRKTPLTSWIDLWKRRTITKCLGLHWRYVNNQVAYRIHHAPNEVIHVKGVSRPPAYCSDCFKDQRTYHQIRIAKHPVSMPSPARLVEVCWNWGDINDVNELIANDRCCKRLYGCLVGDEGWKYVSIRKAEDIKTRLWSSRSHVGFFVIYNAMLCVSDSGEKTEEYTKFIEKEIENHKNSSGQHLYTDAMTSMSAAKHGGLTVIESVTIKKYIVTTRAKLTKKEALKHVGVLYDHRDAILSALAGINDFNVPEMQSLEFMLEKECSMERLIANLKDVLESTERILLYKRMKQTSWFTGVVAVFSVVIALISFFVNIRDQKKDHEMESKAVRAVTQRNG